MAELEMTFVRRWAALILALFLIAPPFPISVATALGNDVPSPGVPVACVTPISDMSLVDDAVPVPSAPECPGVVESLTVTPGLNSAVLSWQPPSNADASQVTSYVIDVRSQSRVVTVAATETSATVTGLANGLKVDFVVYAVNSLGAGPASATVTTTATTGVEGEVAGLIVKFSSDVNVGETIDFFGQFDTVVELPIVDEIASDVMLLELPDSISIDDAEAIADEIANEPDVEWVEPDRFLFIAETSVDGSSTPNDTQWSSSQWNLWDQFGVGIANGNTSVTDGWSEGTGEGSVVAVIDTGITSHPDLDQQIVNGYDFVSDPVELASERTEGEDAVPFDGDYVDPIAFGPLGRDDNPTDPGDWRNVAPVRDSTWHGTAIAGVIAAQANDSLGVAGVAPSALVQPIRALSWRGGLLSDIAASITWASGGSVESVPANATPANVINLSFAVESTCPVSLQEAIDRAIERGAVVIAAAGNASSNAAMFAPGNCDGVINVGATSRDGNRAPYSNWGTAIDVSAPGGSSDGTVTTTSNSGITNAANHSWSTAEGTSVAAAHVAGATAVLRGANPSMTVAEVAERLTGRDYVKQFGDTACDSDPNKTCGSGILDLAQVAMARQGSIDHALDLNGTNQYAVGAGSSTAFKTLNAFTLQTWVRPDVGASCSGDKTLVRKQFDFGLWCGQSSGVNHWWYALGRDGATPSSQNTNIPILAGQWQHLALTRAANQDVVNFYVNGQLAYTGITGGANGGAIRSSDDDLEIGSYLKQYSFFPGDVDEVRLYSAALSQAQIVTDMHTYGMNSAISAGDRRAYFDFNEGSGTTVYNRASGAPSTSHLTTVGSPNFVDVKTTTTTGSDTVVTFPRTYLTSAGGWVVPRGVSTARSLVVAGGGGGGTGDNNTGWQGGGGGAGGYLAAASTALNPGATVAVVVGQGGFGGVRPWLRLARNGQNSQLGVITALGGGSGGSGGDNGVSGGSGGGGAIYTGVGGAGTAGQGFAGGNGAGANNLAAGGGGGSGGAGGNASGTGTSAQGGSGGPGTSNDITGVATFYAAGGGGRGCGSNAPVITPASGRVAAGNSATANTGSGGGGGGDETTGDCATVGDLPGGNGGSGVVIVRYASASEQCTTERTIEGSYTYVAFKDVGTCTWTVPAGVTNVDYLVVGGGGGGGAFVGGGGGAGGLSSGTGLLLRPEQSVSIVVGDGGAGGEVIAGGGAQASNGGTSSISGTGITTVSGTGGGGGGGGGNSGATRDNGSSGGSGGGAVYGSSLSSVGTGVAGEGSNGALGFTRDLAPACYAAGGGGGAGTSGAAGTDCRGGGGGIGAVTTLISATSASRLRVGENVSGSVYLAGGGAGGAFGNTAQPTSTGGSGGGGAGSQAGAGTSGLDFTGGGGGGGGAQSDASGGDGGSGVVILRYEVQDIDYSIGLNGTNQYGIASDIVFNPSADYTIELWTYDNAANEGWRYMASRGAGSGSPTFTLGTWFNSQQIHVATWPTGVDLPVDRWVHLAVTKTGSTATLYMDGTEVARTTSFAPETGWASSNFTIGRTPDDRAEYWNGRIDEVRVWNVARSASDIQAGRHSNMSPTASGLLAYYDFNQGTGTAVHNRKSGASAATNLTLHNTPTFADVKTMSVSASGRSVVTFPRSYITAAGGWTVPQGVTSAEVLVVGGGGGGGFDGGGGGGGGAVVHRPSLAVAPGAGVRVTVGVGGFGVSGYTVPNTVGRSGANGENSVFGSATAMGGGGGGGIRVKGSDSAIGDGRGGGGGGGANHYDFFANPAGGLGGVGCDGCTGGSGLWQRGGGGGSGGGTAGTSATGNNNNTSGGQGAQGVSVAAFGATVYGSGGGGGSWNGGPVAQGGQNAGSGGVFSTRPTVGISNTGGGGGGGGGAGHAGGNGGSGVVIASYSVTSSGSTTCTNPSTTEAADGSGDIVLRFTVVESCTWTPPVGVSRVDALLVAGGGAGGGGIGGGGGGGEVRSLAGQSVGSSVAITVGAGGAGIAGVGGDGGDTTAFGITVNGGGGGGWLASGAVAGAAGRSGGSGGGGGCSTMSGVVNPGSSVKLGAGLGNSGGTGSTGGNTLCVAAGGGGAGSIGSNGAGESGGNGGTGAPSSITGTTTNFGGGGGGGLNGLTSTGNPGAGGSGGGGAGGSKTVSRAGVAATNGLGGGGGGGSNSNDGSNSVAGGSGGSGVVIIRYTPVDATCTPLTYTSGGFTVVEFQTAGTCTWTVPTGVTAIDVLAVGGGGGGGARLGGGGGGGGVVESLGLTASGTATITVGSGGAGGSAPAVAGDRRGANGGNSKVDFVDGALTDITATGGGGGGSFNSSGNFNGQSGATGGGASWGGTAGTGSAGANGGAAAGDGSWKFAGGGGGGGGASGTVGVAGSTTRGGAGGAGTFVNITGADVVYGGGGGGGTHNGSTTPLVPPGLGGLGGGGAGGTVNVLTSGVGSGGVDGVDGLGGGGGGGSVTSGGSETVPGGAGGDGTVIVRYTTSSTVTVTYDDNVANETISVPASQSGNIGTSLTLGVAPSRTGYSFDSWNTIAGGTGTAYAAESSFTIPASNTVLFAQWSIRNYTVTYNDNAANVSITVPAEQTAAFNSSVTLGAAPSRTGHTFSGWNTLADGTGTAYSAETSFTIPASDTVLYAQWNVDSYTVTYNDNVANETISVPATQTAAFNSSVTVGVAPTRTGHTFADWNTVAGGTGTAYSAGVSLTIPASNTVLFAQWTVNNYTITYNDNVANETISVPATQTAAFNSSVTVGVAPTRTGHTFAGWNTAANGTGTALSAGASYTVTATSPTLFAQWTTNSYTVSYNANGGTGGPTTSTVQFGATATVAAAASNPSRTGHTFASWTTNADGTGSSYAPSATFTLGAANVTLFARWTVNNYTVSYDDNVILAVITVPSTQSATYAGTVTVGAAPTRTGHTFAGWNTAANGTGTSYSAGTNLTIPASNTVLYAQWNVNSYNVSYNLNGGSGTAPATQSADFDTSITAASTSSTRTGFTFAGWNTAADGTGSAVAAGVAYTIPAANSTLFAQWTANQYTITFAANDDVANPATSLPANVTGRTYQQNVTLPSGTPSRPNYVFSGWNTAAAGTGVSYAASGAYVMPNNSVTLHAQWTPESFGVVYNANGGITPPTPTNNDFGSTVTVSTTRPTRTGHTFQWWTISADGTGNTYRNPALGSTVSTFTMPGSQVTLFAQWEVNSYNLNYDANLGSNAPSGQSIAFNATATASVAVPTRAGYQFLGWNTVVGGTGTTYAAGGTFPMPAANLTLYAQWQAITYTLAYNTNGGDSAAPTAQSATTDSSVTVSSIIPTRTGYDFAGWNTQVGGFGTTRTPSGTFTMPASNVTLFAQWNAQTLSISYNGNGGSGIPTGQSGLVDSSVTISSAAPTRTGYTFAGWNTAADGTGTSRTSGSTFIMPTAAFVLYAQWQAINYSVSYEANNGVGAPSASSHTYLEAVTLSTAVPTRAGYWFNGWNTAADGSAMAHTTGGNVTMPATNVTLYAQWVADIYRVVYNANGGEDAPDDQVLATDSTVSVSTQEPTRVGHEFLYWTTTQNGTGPTYANPASGSATNNFTMPPSNTTLFAQWSVLSYTLSYNVNLGAGAPSGGSTQFGTTVTVSSTVPTRIGHTFTGWNTAANGSGVSYVAGNTLSMPASALTLHAQWVADTFSIVYFANGGSTAPAAQSATYGTTASVSATPASRSGYTFDGWNTQTDGQGISRASGSSFTMSNANVELYARWTAQSFAVSFNANDGIAAPDNISGTTDSTVTIPSTIPTRTGYDFLGWNTLQVGTGVAYQVGSTLTMPPNNLVLWAQWQPRKFTVVYNVNGGATNAPVGKLAATDSSVQAASTTPSRVGYQFVSWNSEVDGSGVSASAGANFSMPPSDVTLFALWSAIIYTVTYEANGGRDVPAAQSAGTDSTVTVSPTVPNRPGHTFSGWNTQADGSGVAYASAATFTMPVGNVSLWAQWTLAPVSPAPSMPPASITPSAPNTPSAPSAPAKTTTLPTTGTEVNVLMIWALWILVAGLLILCIAPVRFRRN